MGAAARRALALVGTAVLISGCDHGPTAPTSGTATASGFSSRPVLPAPALLVAVPVSPVNGATVAAGYLPLTGIPGSTPVTLVARNTSTTADLLTLDTFEVAIDAGFTHTAAIVNVPRATGGETVARVTVTAGRQYFWHVRAARSETVGPFSNAFAFTTSALPEATTLFAGPPTPLQPTAGALLNGDLVTLVVVNGAHSQNPAGYEFQVASDPPFAGRVTPCITSEFEGTVQSRCPVGRFAPGVYYWRAQTVVTRSGSSFGGGSRSPFSATSTFTVVSGVIQFLNVVRPIAGENLHNPVTLTVNNVAHTGTGPLAYEFRVYTTPGAGPSTPGASAIATVPEGPTQTFWTIPFALPVGVTYWWEVRAVDRLNGVASSPAGPAQFRVVTSRANLFRLHVQPPPTCNSSLLSHISLYATSMEAAGAAHFLLETSGGLSLDLRNSGGALVGTIGGSTDDTSIAASASDAGPAPTSGIMSTDGTMTGTFGGLVTGRNAFGDSGRCSGSGFQWTITPVSQ